MLIWSHIFDIRCVECAFKSFKSTPCFTLKVFFQIQINPLLSQPFIDYVGIVFQTKLKVAQILVALFLYTLSLFYTRISQY